MLLFYLKKYYVTFKKNCCHNYIFFKRVTITSNFV